MTGNTDDGRADWRRIAALLALLGGGFVVFLALGLDVVGSDGVSPGAVVVFAALVLVGGSVAGWGVRELRG